MLVRAKALLLLAAYLRVKALYGVVGSKLAKESLKKYKIKFYF